MDAPYITKRIKNDKVLLISGLQGMGKSTLAREVHNILKEEGILTSLINCEKENITPYSDLIKLLNGLPGIENIHNIIKPSKIIGYFVMNTGGLLLATTLTESESVDSDILAGMITAVRNFIYETMNMLGLDGLSESPQVISSAGNTLIVSRITGGYLATLLKGQSAISTLAYVRRIANEISLRFGEKIERWEGDKEKVNDLLEFMEIKVRENVLFYPERGEIVSALSKNLPKDRAIIFILDDAHWIDPTSLDIISSFSEWDIENIHTIYFFNQNHAKKHESFIKMAERYKEKIITLNPWSVAIVRKKLLEKYGEQPWIDELSSKIVEKTGGIVMLVMEIISNLEEYGILRKFGDSYIFNRKVLESLNSMSHSSVQRIWDGKINNLPQETRKVLRIFSVIGDSIPIDFAAKLTKMDEMDLMMTLDPAIEGKIVVLEGDVIRFRHQGLRKSLYSSLSETQAKIYHRYVGKLMEERGKAPSQIAYYYWMAKDPKGIKYLREAVDIAEKMQTYLEMNKYCSMALDLVTKESEKFYFLTKKAKACNVLGYMNESLELLEEAEKLAKEHKDYKEVFSLLSSAYFRMGYYSKVVESAERFSGKVGEENQNYVLLELARAMWRLGDLKRGEDYLKDILKNKMEDELAMEVYRLYGVIKSSLRDTNSAEDYYLKSLEIAKKLGDLYGMSAASNNLAIIYVDHGDLEKGEQFYRQSVEFDKKLGDLRGLSLVMINLGELLITKGQLKEGEELFREIVEIKKSIGDMEGLGFAYNGLADALFLQGKYRESLNYILMAISSFSEIEYKEGLGFTSVLASRIYFELGESEKSFNMLKRSEEIFRGLEDSISLENVKLQHLEFKIKMNENVELPPLKNDDNQESYYYLMALLNAREKKIEEAIKKLQLCYALSNKSKNFITDNFYCGAIQILSHKEGDCISNLEKIGAKHYLNEFKYFISS